MCPNGEVEWTAADAPAVVIALAASGRVVLGLDVRDYSDRGEFTEIAWSVLREDGSDPVEAGRQQALTALSRELPGEWIVVTWRRP